MTFKCFEAIVKHCRPEITVSKHGEFCYGDSKYTLGVTFGKNSKVYSYSGSYADVLCKLKCTDYSLQEYRDWYIKEIEKLENRLKNPHKGLSLFKSDEEVDNWLRKEIETKKQELAEEMARPLFDNQGNIIK